MNVGDLIRCGQELGVILDYLAKPPGILCKENICWLNVLWQDGDIEGISPEDVDEVL